MKKLLLMILVLMLATLPALAETQIFCAGDTGISYEISQRLAAAMDDAVVVTAADHLSAINQFLAADKDSALYIGDPSVMILSLQGYTDADLRTAIAPVARIASCPATVYAAQGVLNLCEDVTEQGLITYTENMPFEIFIARLIDASPVDFITLEATALMYVDQNLYMDYAEMAQAAQDGAIDLCVFGAEVPAELSGVLTPLYTAAQDGPFLGAFTHTGAAGAADAEAVLLSVLAQEEVQTLLKDAGYTPDSQKAAADFSEEVKALFAAYIQYLTNEGLFFYEF